MIRNPSFNSAGGVDCEVKHPDLGWVPYTVNSIDQSALASIIYPSLLSMGPVPYIPIDPDEVLAHERAQMQCTRRQARIVLGQDTCAALDALADDPETPWAMRQTLLYAQTWERTAPEIDEIGWALGYDAEQIDALFRAASTT